MARRAIRRAMQHRTCWRQREPRFLAFCPSDLPVKISEALGTSYPHDSSPKRSPDLAFATPREFLQEGCGAAAQDVTNGRAVASALLRGRAGNRVANLLGAARGRRLWRQVSELGAALAEAS